jgi:hypothetical protein
LLEGASALAALDNPTVAIAAVPAVKTSRRVGWFPITRSFRHFSSFRR